MFFQKLKSFIRDYFTLTSRERKGALVLASIIIIQILIIFFMHYVIPPSEVVITRYKPVLEAFEKRLQQNENKTKPLYNEIKPTLHPVPFDPNTIPDSRWEEMGLTSKQIAVIRNFLDKGGRFHKKEDVAKMYCISDKQYQILAPFIQIAEREKDTVKIRSQFKARQPKLNVQLNTADTIELAKLPMIGAGRARMIWKYRERLGGFVSEHQLLEVFTLDSSVVEAIHPFITIDISHIRKLNMNSDSLSHPYLNRKTAAAIVSYRKLHGNFTEVNDLRKVLVVDEQLWIKVAPYASFE